MKKFESMTWKRVAKLWRRRAIELQDELVWTRQQCAHLAGLLRLEKDKQGFQTRGEQAFTQWVSTPYDPDIVDLRGSREESDEAGDAGGRRP